MNKDNLVQLTKDLINVNSSNPPGNEKVVADLLKSRLEKLGLEVTYLEAAIDRPNMIATWKGEGDKKLIIAGHTDTVPAGNNWEHDPFNATVAYERIYGRGAADMKGGLAAMIICIENLKESGWTPNGDLIFLGYANEETGDGEEIGMRYVADKVDADAMLICDSTDFDIVTAEKGVLWVEIEALGKEAHGSRPWEGINAIEKLGKFLIKLNSMTFPAEHQILGKTTVSVNTISGGYKTNVVPSHAKAKVDIRIVPGETKEMILEKLEELKKTAEEEDKDMKINIKEMMYYEPVELPNDHPAISLLVSSAEEVLGKKLKFKAEHAATGAGVFIKAGIPTIVFGPGKPEQCHAKDEYVDIKDLEDICNIYEKFIKKFFG